MTRHDAAWMPATALPLSVQSFAFNLSMVGSTLGEYIYLPDDSSVNGRTVVGIRTSFNAQVNVPDSSGVNSAFTFAQLAVTLLHIEDVNGRVIVDNVAASRFCSQNIWRRLYFQPGFQIDMERSYVQAMDPGIVNKELFLPIELLYL